MNLKEILKEIPRIELSKVNLRKIEHSDSEALYQYYNNKNVYQHLDWNGPQSVAHAKEIISRWNSGFDEGWILRFAIADKTGDQIIGTIFLNGFDGKRAETGYELSENFWNRGIMSEAIDAVLHLAFSKLSLERIQAEVSIGNTASAKVLEKNGFKYEGLLRKYETHGVTGEVKDMRMFSVIKNE